MSRWEGIGRGGVRITKLVLNEEKKKRHMDMVNSMRGMPLTFDEFKLGLYFLFSWRIIDGLSVRC